MLGAVGQVSEAFEFGVVGVEGEDVVGGTGERVGQFVVVVEGQPVEGEPSLRAAVSRRVRI